MPYLYRVAYDGALFHGFTGHPNSVEAALRRVFGHLLGRGSRTDPGVSAVGNAVLAPSRLPLGYINSRLPRGVWTWAVADVGEGFNPRRARRRRYLYVAPHWGEDVEAMREVAELFKGTHDFSSFIQFRGERGAPPVTTVEEVGVEVVGRLVYLYFVGKGFRNKQIRKMAWAILAAGRGVVSRRYVEELLETPRPGAVPSAPAEGLILLDIEYDVKFDVDRGELRKAYVYFLEKYRRLEALAAAYRAAGEQLLFYDDL